MRTPTKAKQIKMAEQAKINEYKATIECLVKESEFSRIKLKEKDEKLKSLGINPSNDNDMQVHTRSITPKSVAFDIVEILKEVQVQNPANHLSIQDLRKVAFRIKNIFQEAKPLGE